MRLLKADGRFNRPAPAPGWRYVAVDKVAKYWHDLRFDVAMHGNNVNAHHVFGGWHLGYQPTDETRDNETFDYIAWNFKSYMDRELGTYVVFLVKPRG